MPPPPGFLWTPSVVALTQHGGGLFAFIEIHSLLRVHFVSISSNAADQVLIHPVVFFWSQDSEVPGAGMEWRITEDSGAPATLWATLTTGSSLMQMTSAGGIALQAMQSDRSWFLEFRGGSEVPDVAVLGMNVVAS